MKKSENLEMFRKIAEDTVNNDIYKNQGYIVQHREEGGKLYSVEVISPKDSFMLTGLVLTAKALDVYCSFHINSQQQIVLMAF